MIRCKNLEADNSMPKQRGGGSPKIKLTKLEKLRNEILEKFPPSLLEVLRKNELFD